MRFNLISFLIVLRFSWCRIIRNSSSKQKLWHGRVQNCFIICKYSIIYNMYHCTYNSWLSICRASIRTFASCSCKSENLRYESDVCSVASVWPMVHHERIRGSEGSSLTTLRLWISITWHDLRIIWLKQLPGTKERLWHSALKLHHTAIPSNPLGGGQQEGGRTTEHSIGY